MLEHRRRVRRSEALRGGLLNSAIEKFERIGVLSAHDCPARRDSLVDLV
jgi:hypothetical protein